jgi:hypothetical protein
VVPPQGPEERFPSFSGFFVLKTCNVFIMSNLEEKINTIKQEGLKTLNAATNYQ